MADSVTYYEDQKLFLLTTSNTAYLIGQLPGGGLIQLYWGPRLPRLADYPVPPPDRQHSSDHARLNSLLAELPTLHGIQEIEPCIRTVFHDGTRDLRLSYQSHHIDVATGELAILLKDHFYPLEVTLRYRIFADCDLITRRVELTNRGSEPVELEEVLSGSLVLPFERAGQYRLTHLAGAWAMETQVNRTMLTPGRKLLEGRHNYTGHLANPFWALDLVGPEGAGASETAGEVWFGGLAWGGNWKIVVEQLNMPAPLTRVAAGLNDWDFSWHLGAGQSFETPWLTIGYTNQGWGQVSRNLHRYQRRHVLPAAFAEKLRPVLYNSWEAVHFAVNQSQQMTLAEKAARLGAELFVVDDGWFGERDHDRAGLGDWTPNLQKFPQGLTPLIERVNGLGMQFGLWVEPEMVNPDSDLYRAHPNWVYHFPTRDRTTSRNQLMLNLARPEVEQYLFEMLDRLLADHNISYIKWDFNRTISEAGWPDAPAEQQREFWVRHVQAFYRLVDRLRHNHPAVSFEACAGGGGRADMGTLSHFDHVWTSDNTDPYDRLPIQQGYSLAYAPNTMYCWVTNWDHNRSHYTLRYRFFSSFMGSLGIGADLNQWSETETQEAADLIASYKAIRPLIQHGEFYRLTGLSEAERMAVQYLAEDGSECVVLAFHYRRHFWQPQPRLLLQGLNPQAIYEVVKDSIEDMADSESNPLQMSGQALMSLGLTTSFHETYDSNLFILKRL